MHVFDQAVSTPAEALACDEVLLDHLEDSRGGAALRFWEPQEYFAVLGYAKKAAQEVNLSFCERQGIPVLRRCTGGGTVLQGPGVLNYSLVFEINEHGPTSTITGVNNFVMEKNRVALAKVLNSRVENKGFTDLVLDGLKFSGNAQRRKKHCLLFHGCFLLNLDITMVSKTLKLPGTQPEYRQHRSHQDFLVNLGIPASTIKTVLVEEWQANEGPLQLPLDDIRNLALTKYETKEWNFKF
jgi:lipoate-protein ligase A